ncbi:glycoside hydrolase family 5 protein [Stappia sp. ES.058]|uniref:glycoside hydrolase family 5 protein n=1 Tax=Stappia sp. ES.058 TaxID=1881061 RepID=UPI00087B3B3C|nr:glycoside hydrolase family 5 protein [Stappia sp. ES.058]SDU48846.1 Cellulase family 5 [Stappia sp. ES.058]
MRGSDARASYRTWAVLGAVLMLAIALSARQAGADCLRGANVAGAEFGDLPGVHAKTYIYPSRATLSYLRAKGMNAVRLPFRWERLQPKLDAPLSDSEFSFLDKTVAEAADMGLTVILDPHNYARYRGDFVGGDTVPASAFADFWRRLAVRYKGREKVVFLLMNEPTGIFARDWLPSVNAAIAAIRETGADNLVMVPGTIWTGASHWFDEQPGGSNAEVLTGVVDPLNRFVFDVHQYMDADFSGTKTACSRVDDAMTAIGRLTRWLEETGNAAFLGEFGGHARPDCYRGLVRLAGYLNARPDVWAGWAIWAAGDWWGDYPLSVQPEDGLDRPQMVAISRLIARRSQGEKACPALDRP